MRTISQEPTASVRRPAWFEARNMWASLAITTIWLVVLVTSLFGPDFKSFDVAGNTTIIPSGLGIAFFGLFGTIAVAKYGFDRRRDG
jgi:hypothetical protein